METNKPIGIELGLGLGLPCGACAQGIESGF